MGKAETWTWKCMGSFFFFGNVLISLLVGEGNRCHAVTYVNPFTTRIAISSPFLDRASLSKDPDSRDSQVHAQLAHAVVRFLGLNSFQEMTEYGMDSAADLVDLISRVC